MVNRLDNRAFEARWFAIIIFILGVIVVISSYFYLPVFYKRYYWVYHLIYGFLFPWLIVIVFNKWLYCGVLIMIGADVYNEYITDKAQWIIAHPNVPFVVSYSQLTATVIGSLLCGLVYYILCKNKIIY